MVWLDLPSPIIIAQPLYRAPSQSISLRLLEQAQEVVVLLLHPLKAQQPPPKRRKRLQFRRPQSNPLPAPLRSRLLGTLATILETTKSARMKSLLRRRSTRIQLTMMTEKSATTLLTTMRARPLFQLTVATTIAMKILAMMQMFQPSVLAPRLRALLPSHLRTTRFPRLLRTIHLRTLHLEDSLVSVKA